MDFWTFLEKYEPIIEKFRQYQNRIYSVIILFVLVNLTINVLIPSWQIYLQQSKELKAYQQTLERKRGNSLDKESMEKEIHSFQTELQTKEKTFFTPEEYTEFSINSLSHTAESYENTVVSVRYKAAENRGNRMETRPLSLTLEGPFMGVAGVMDELENLGKFVRISSFSLTQKSINPPMITAILELEPYVIP